MPQGFRPEQGTETRVKKNAFATPCSGLNPCGISLQADISEMI
jgi:hypothetical protein